MILKNPNIVSSLLIRSTLPNFGDFSCPNKRALFFWWVGGVFLFFFFLGGGGGVEVGL